MKIKVAGAGAGKTISMAHRIQEHEIPDGKVVYCVAFTNAAADSIRLKLADLYGSIPRNIKVSTIHSFFYSELILPYYHLVFGKRYQSISTIVLPDKPQHRNVRIHKLDEQGLLHQSVIPQRAKWLVSKKSGDTRSAKSMRKTVLSLFSGYCDAIYVDEAQDMDEDICAVLVALDHAGVNIELVGDPEQDVRGHGRFRQLIEENDDVTYTNECHRCPQAHLDLSNRLVPNAERQISTQLVPKGSINLYFESETNVPLLVAHRHFGLIYISRKNDRFETHTNQRGNERLDDIRQQLVPAIHERWPQATDLEVNRAAYYAAEKMISQVDAGALPNDAIRPWIRRGFFSYSRQPYAQLASTLAGHSEHDASKIPAQSIEAVKGLEHENCLFILTTDLAPYLLGDKTDDNKTKHLLYVALTRSSNELSVLVTKEVEAQYPRQRITAVIKPESQPAGCLVDSIWQPPLTPRKS